MLIEIINKVLMVLFFTATINAVRHGYYFLQAVLNTDKENPVKYVLNKVDSILLLISIAYILTAIFTGIKL